MGLFFACLTISLVQLFLCIQPAVAHMEMSQPLPINSRFDPQVPQQLVDYNLKSPLTANGSNFPCHGYQNQRPIRTTASYIAGQTYSMTIAGTASHGGGSCQLSLSYDNGATFKVIKSMIGGCPLTLTYDFTVPAYAPSGNALFAWTWFNEIGNREMYMNCAWVQVSGSSKARRGNFFTRFLRRAATFYSMDSLPFIWKANVAGISNCDTVEGTDPVFGNPGPDVVYGSGKDSTSPVTLPDGNCDLSGPTGQTFEDLSTTDDSTSSTDTGSATSSTSSNDMDPSSTTQMTSSTSTPSSATTTPGVFAEAPQNATSSSSPSTSSSSMASSSTDMSSPSTNGTSSLSQATATSLLRSTSTQYITISCNSTTSLAPSSITTQTSTTDSSMAMSSTTSSPSTSTTTTMTSDAAPTSSPSAAAPSSTSTTPDVSSATSTSPTTPDTPTIDPTLRTYLTIPSAQNLTSYLPCVPGSFLCTSLTSFVICDQGPFIPSMTPSQVFKGPLDTAEGMQCMPFLQEFPDEETEENFGGASGGAPEGYFRSDRYVVAGSWSP